MSSPASVEAAHVRAILRPSWAVSDIASFWRRPLIPKCGCGVATVFPYARGGYHREHRGESGALGSGTGEQRSMGPRSRPNIAGHRQAIRAVLGVPCGTRNTRRKGGNGAKTKGFV